MSNNKNEIFHIAEKKFYSFMRTKLFFIQSLLLVFFINYQKLMIYIIIHNLITKKKKYGVDITSPGANHFWFAFVIIKLN